MKLCIAAIVAAALACTPVMARSHDSPPVFTEKIDQAASSPSTKAETVVADTQRNAPSAMTIVRFDQKHVHFAVLPAVPKQMAEFDAYSVDFARISNHQALAIDDAVRNPNTT